MHPLLLISRHSTFFSCWAGMGLLRFELKSITPEATRIPSYPTGPNSQNKNRKRIKDVSVKYSF